MTTDERPPGMQPGASSGASPERAAWVAERRSRARERYDTRFASTYDEHWSTVSPSHARHLAALLASLRPGSQVLDAACGTGKYWPVILAAGHHVSGIDQSSGMVAVASRKHRDVPVRVLGLQELDDEAAWDAVVCIDAMEFVAPDDWPAVVHNLRRALREGGRLYLTVELAAETAVDAKVAAARAAGHPVVDGEDYDEGGGYHYYPGPDRALAWVAGAGFQLDESSEGDEYLHVLATAV